MDASTEDIQTVMIDPDHLSPGTVRTRADGTRGSGTTTVGTVASSIRHRIVADAERRGNDLTVAAFASGL